MDPLKKILYHFIAHQDEYLELFPGKYVVITADFRTAGAYDTEDEARRRLDELTSIGASYYRAIPGEQAFTIYRRS